jgi:hypothetical protein
MARSAPSPCAARPIINLACVSSPEFEESDMGFTMISLAGALGSLRRLVRSALGAPAGRHVAAASFGRAGNRLHMAEGRGHVAWPAPHAPCNTRRLRVLRVVDAGHAPSTAGRMVISGRMADVCAELDRLAALEGAAA